jgi:hypothetical protein
MIFEALLFIPLALWLLLSPYVIWPLLQKKLFVFNEEADGSQPDFAELCRTLTAEGFELIPMQIAGSSGELLCAYFFRHPRSSLVFNFHMGRNNSLFSCVAFLRAYTRFGSVFLCEPEGFGASKGKPSFKTFVGCGITSHQALLQLGYQDAQIIPCGDSLGSSAATAEAAHFGSRAVILSAAFESMVRMAKEQLPLLRIYPHWMFPRHTRMDNLENLRRFKGAILLLHGLRDQLIPIAHSVSLKEAAPGRATLVELDSEHRDTAGHDPQTFLFAVDLFVRIWLGSDVSGATAGGGAEIVPITRLTGRAGGEKGGDQRMFAASRATQPPIENDNGGVSRARPSRRSRFAVFENVSPRPPRLASDRGETVIRTRPRLATNDGKPVDPSKDGNPGSSPNGGK